MDVNVGDILTMKKSHPCGGKEFDVLRVGMDFKIVCKKCGRVIDVFFTESIPDIIDKTYIDGAREVESYNLIFYGNCDKC